jgi:hypothetical protein
MKRPARFLVLGTVAFIFGAFFLFGPSAIHVYYRAITPSSLIQTQMNRNALMEQQEVAMEGQARARSEQQRRQIVLWLSARGVPDWDSEEGDPPPSPWKEWADLFAYWRGK